jgi:hypothetical protein
MRVYVSPRQVPGSGGDGYMAAGWSRPHGRALPSQPARARAKGARASESASQAAAAMAAWQRLKAASTAPIIAADAAEALRVWQAAAVDEPAADAVAAVEAGAARARWSATACLWRARAPMLLAAPMRKSWGRRGLSGAYYEGGFNKGRETERACHSAIGTLCIGVNRTHHVEKGCHNVAVHITLVHGVDVNEALGAKRL